MMLWKCCTQHASKFGKLSSGHKTGKGQFSFQAQRRVMPKNVQTTTQLRSSHMLAKWSSKFSKWVFNSTWTVNFQMFRLVFKKVEEPEIQLPTCWIIKKAKEFQKNIYFCFIDYAKAFDCGSQQTVENSSRDGITRPPDLPPEKSVCRSQSNS